MILTKTQSTFKRSYFDDVITDYAGDALIKDTDFTVVEPGNISGTVTAHLQISVTSGHGLSAGDNIAITGSDGVARKNYIKAVGDTVIEVKDVLDPTQPSVTIRKDFYSVTLTDTVKEGIYSFSDNEALLVADAYYDLFVPYSAIQSRDENVSSNIDIDLVNAEAKKSIMADFSFDVQFFRKVDMNNLRELQIIKILSFTGDSERRTEYREAYATLQNAIRNIIEKDEEGNINLNPVDDSEVEDFDGGISVGWGVR